MPIKTITQIRADTPTVTLADSDLFLLDQATKTVAGSLAQLKAFVRPTNATTTTAGLMSAADKTKLTSIPANATANQTDTYLLERANHTGTQAIGSIVGLQTELNKKIESVNVAGVTGLQDALDLKADAEDVAALDGRMDDAETAITGLGADKLDASNPTPTGSFKFPSYTFAGKPDPTGFNGRYIEITGTVDGVVLARSDGTNWIKVAVVGPDVVAAP